MYIYIYTFIYIHTKKNKIHDNSNLKLYSNFIKLWLSVHMKFKIGTEEQYPYIDKYISDVFHSHMCTWFWGQNILLPTIGLFARNCILQIYTVSMCACIWIKGKIHSSQKPKLLFNSKYLSDYLHLILALVVPYG